MSDTKNVSILDENDKEPEVKSGTPIQAHVDVIKSVFHKFRYIADARDMNFNNFDGINLIEYIEDSVQRFITNVDYRDNIEDWQARVNDPFTHNKVMAVLGKVVQVLPMAQFTGRGDEDIRRGQLLTNLYEYSEDVDDYEEFMVNFLLEAVVKGTAVGYEGHEAKTQKIRTVKGSGDNIKVERGTKKTNKLFAKLVRLEDFYPSSVGIRRIKDMPYCFWRTTVNYQTFLQDYAMFKAADQVESVQTFEENAIDRPFYLDYVSDDIVEGNVEIIQYYNQDVDEYIILANGVWLNPMSDNKTIAPLPFNHKQLPFWEVRFETLDPNFFYGKSLPDKLKSLQDVLNVMTNMLLDQSFLTIFPPMLSNGVDFIEDDYLRPGRRTPIDTQGIPINDAFMKLDLGTPGNWHQFILDYTRKIMEEASLDQVSSGTAGAGDRTTAQEIRVAAEGVASMLGLFARVVKYGIKQKSLLRGKNILQFWTTKKSPIVEQILGVGGMKKLNQAFNIVKLDNAVMTNGKRGMKIIEMFANKADMPDKAQLKNRASIFKMETNKEIEVIAIPGEYLRNLEFDIKVVANPTSEQTREVEKALQLEKVKVYKTFWPNLVDDFELAAQTAEKMGDDPTKIFKRDAFEQGAGQGDNKDLDQSISTKPQGNAANNAVRGLRGGEQEANDLVNLGRNMTG